MKFAFLTLVTTLASFTQAFASPIPADQLKSYQTAVDLAIQARANTFNCETKFGLHPLTIQSIVDNATSAELNTSGAQPVLVFTALDPNGTEKEVATITTAPDYKSIASLTGTLYLKGPENEGDLENPVIVSGFVLDSTAICR